MYNLHDTEIHTGLYGKDVDLCIQTLIEYASQHNVKWGNAKIHYAKHLYVERYPNGEVVLTFCSSTLKKNSEQMKRSLLGFYSSALNDIATSWNLNHHGTNSTTFIPAEYFFVFIKKSEAWDSPYFRFQRNDSEEYVNETMSFKFGFAWAIHDLLSGIPDDEVRAKYGYKFVDEVKGVPNTPFEALTIETLKKNLADVKRAHWEKVNELEAERKEEVAKLELEYEIKKKDEERIYEASVNTIREELTKLGAHSDF